MGAAEPRAFTALHGLGLPWNVRNFPFSVGKGRSIGAFLVLLGDAETWRRAEGLSISCEPPMAPVSYSPAVLIEGSAKTRVNTQSASFWRK